MDADSQPTVLWRLKCLQGHVNGLIRMLIADEPTPALLKQINAIHGGLEKVKQQLILIHLEECKSLAVRSERTLQFERALRALEAVYRSDRQAPKSLNEKANISPTVSG